MHPQNDTNNDEDNFVFRQGSIYTYYFQFSVFMIMGSGASWVFPNALAQEIPYLEQRQPEGLCVATYMNAATNIGLVVMFAYILVNKYVCAIPNSLAVPSLLVTSAVVAYVTAVDYSITIQNISIFLFISCAISGSIGALSSVIFTPFVTAYENDYISAARAGNSFFTLLCALIAIPQQPGTRDRFPVSIYFFIFGMILTLPIFAYFYIIKTGIGLKPVRLLDPRYHSYSSDLELTSMVPSSPEPSTSVSNPLNKISFVETSVAKPHTINLERNKPDMCMKESEHASEYRASFSPKKSERLPVDREADYTMQFSPCSNQISKTVNSMRTHLYCSRDDLETIASVDADSNQMPINPSKTTDITTASGRFRGSYVMIHTISQPVCPSTERSSSSGGKKVWIDRTVESFVQCVVYNSLASKIPWLRQAMPYMMTVGWVNFNTWGVLSAVTPFAFKYRHSLGLDGPGLLAVAYEVAGICLVLGDLSTTCFRLSFRYALLAFTICCIAIYVGTFNPTVYDNEVSGPFLVVFFSLGRFFEAHLLTSSYRYIATQFPADCRESASRAVGISDQVSTTLGAVVSTSIVSAIASC